jgi:hypothetical protein
MHKTNSAFATIALGLLILVFTCNIPGISFLYIDFLLLLLTASFFTMFIVILKDVMASRKTVDERLYVAADFSQHL